MCFISCDILSCYFISYHVLSVVLHCIVFISLLFYFYSIQFFWVHSCCSLSAVIRVAHLRRGIGESQSASGPPCPAYRYVVLCGVYRVGYIVSLHIIFFCVLGVLLRKVLYCTVCAALQCVHCSILHYTDYYNTAHSTALHYTALHGVLSCLV